jgi:hypothetical protein
MLGFAWRAEAVLARLTGRLPRITRDSVRAAVATNSYDGSALAAYLPNGAYTPWEQTVAELRRDQL